MTTICDSITMKLLHRVVGMRLEKLAARRYPGYPSYSEIVAKFSEGLSLRVDLADETITANFEVFVARVRLVDQPGDCAEWDLFELGDFSVANVFVLRRAEWIANASNVSYPPVGRHAVEQHFGSLHDGNSERGAVVVDSGLCFISTRGAELALDADTFPLVFQLRYEVASSPLPQGSRIPVSEHEALR